MQMGAGTVRLVGVGALGAGIVSAAVLAVDGIGRVGGAWTGEGPTIYGPQQLLLSVTLAGAGLLLLVGRSPVAAAAALGVAGLCAGQLAGTGLVATRRWPLYRGCCSTESITEEGMVTTLAMLMAGVCALAAVACLVLLMAGRYATWSHPATARAIGLAAGGVVMAVGPLLVVNGRAGDSDIEDLLAWALMCSVPIGAALALSGTLQRPAAWTVLGVVVASALAATVGKSFLETRLPWGSAQALVIAAAVVVTLSRIVPEPQAPYLATDSST